jgi:hypothetical protein
MRNGCDRFQVLRCQGVITIRFRANALESRVESQGLDIGLARSPVTWIPNYEASTVFVGV